MQRGIGETARTSSGTTDSRNGGVSNQRSEGDVAGLDVDVGTEQIRACVRPDGGVCASGRVTDCVGLADHAEKLASGCTHGVLHVHVG